MTSAQHEPWGVELKKLLHRADAERLRIIVSGHEYDVPIPVGRELEELRQYVGALSKIVSDLAALVPISETVAATRNGAAMAQWFKEHLKGV